MRNQVRIEAKIGLLTQSLCLSRHPTTKNSYCFPMDPGFYTISFEIILKWMLVGFAITFFLKDFQRHLQKRQMPLKVAIILAITVSIVLLFLLIEGYDLTIISILSIGGGMVLHLLVLTVMAKLHQFFSAKPLIHSKT